MFEKLFKLKSFKAPGPDCIHPFTLKECSSSICKPLCMLFNQSLQFRQLPKTGNMLTSFLSLRTELSLKPATTDQSVSFHKLLKS